MERRLLLALAMLVTVAGCADASSRGDPRCVGLTACSVDGVERCVDLRADDQHCGACGHACGTNQSCLRGSCACSWNYFGDCGGRCVNLRSDPDNCGACGHACGAAERCVEARCVCDLSIASLCGFRCVDTASDNDNCGLCGRTCGPGTSCEAGLCRCVEGRSLLCRDGCFDASNDETHCGACGRACAPGESCRGGACACLRSDLDTNPQHCGECGRRCGDTQGCRGGECVCVGARERACGSECVDVARSLAHCGACNAACPPGATACVDGACMCPGVRGAVCGSECRDLDRDVMACGACGHLCASGARCIGGECVPRLVVPASGVRLGTARPTFRWAGAIAPRGRVQVCADRACSRVVVNIDGFATSATPGEDLPSGVLFWRAGDPSTGAYSSTRVFAVNRVVSASGSVTGTLHDVDGDGLADVVVGAPGGSLVSLWRGRRGATPDAPVSIHRASPAGFGARVGLAGDLYGEGGGELVVGGNEDEWTPLGSTVRFREGSFDEPHVDEFRGDSVVGVGDVDADGFDDLIARNRHWVRIDVFHGYSIGLSLDSHDFWPAPSTDDAVSLAPAWDVNHDDHDEVLVGVPWRAGGTGVAHVVMGYGMPSAGSIMLPPPLGVTGFGARVAALRDIDGDGLSDALVEARAPRFRAYVYRASSLTEAPQAIEGPAGSVVRVVAVGDVDGDGYADALLPLPSSSRALLYRGSVGGFVTSPLAIEGPEWARATEPVVGTGDVDGDGFDDVAVGDPLRGIVRLYFGDATRPLIRQTTLTGSADEGFGAALALNDSSTASAPNSTRRAWWG